MQDEFLTLLGWFGDLLQRPISDFFAVDSEEYAILTRLKDGWGACDTAELLRGLTADYGDAAGQAVEEFLELNLLRDWPEVGKREAHQGTEMEDFFRVMWEPLKEQGFEYTIDRQDGTATFCVTKCPIHQLAERTGLHEWLYHLACSTDYYSTAGFSPKLEFSRTKTLIQGDDCCNHRYAYKK